MDRANLRAVESQGTQSITVSQTGAGDFKSIAKAVEHADSGATIHIQSGFYEEAIVVSKPLSLVGDPDGLVVITNSYFAMLTVLSTELKIANIAFASGLRLPSIDITDSIVHFKDSILWALDSFLKETNPSLLPARELVGESFLGASMRNSIAIGSMIADILGFPKRSAPLEEKKGAMAEGPAPDVLVRSGSALNISNSFIGMANLLALGRSAMSFADCRLDYPALAWSKMSDATFSGCQILGECARSIDVVAGVESNGTHLSKKLPSPDPVKQEREAALLLRIKELAGARRAVMVGDQPEAKVA